MVRTTRERRLIKEALDIADIVQRLEEEGKRAASTVVPRPDFVGEVRAHITIEEPRAFPRYAGRRGHFQREAGNYGSGAV